MLNPDFATLNNGPFDFEKASNTDKLYLLRLYDKMINILQNSTNQAARDAAGNLAKHFISKLMGQNKNALNEYLADENKFNQLSKAVEGRNWL